VLVAVEETWALAILLFAVLGDKPAFLSPSVSVTGAWSPSKPW